MSLDSPHPKYALRLPEWTLVEDVHAGEDRVKARAAAYLPPTSGMVAAGYGQGDPNAIGELAYNAYRDRAVFHDFFREAIVGMVGAIHRNPPKISVPDAMKPIVEKATIAGEPLHLLWQRITEHQLTSGRCGLLVDVSNGQTPDAAIPYLALYAGTAIINWDVGQRRQGRQELELVVLDESEWERQQNLSWRFVKQIRVLARQGTVVDAPFDDQSKVEDGVYVVAIARGNGADDQLSDFTGALETLTWTAPSIAGNTVDAIPWTFINVNDLVADPDVPPLMGLARLAITIYRGEADYRQTLFLQGQETVVRIGATEDQQKIPVGAGAVIEVQQGGDAKYIGPSGAGLSEQRQALENDKAQAGRYTIQMLDANTDAAESGAALRIRVSARTATLVSIQMTAAGGIKEALTNAGRMMGLSDAQLAQIEVEPNLDFADDAIDAQTISTIVTAKVQGLPLSWRSIHAWLKQNGYTTLEYDDEKEEIAHEQSDFGGAGATPVNVDPNAPADQQPPPQPGAGAAPPFGGKPRATGAPTSKKGQGPAPAGRARPPTGAKKG